MTHPTDQHLAQLEAAVRSRIGFDPQSVGDRTLLRTLGQRMTEGGISDGDSYVATLLLDEAEFDSFVEDLVVPETWFFRDRQPFRCLGSYVTRRWKSAPSGDRLRVLSIPCSTGEEPYSIAMVLLDLGLTPSQFQIDGADLSGQALKQAAEGVYGESSFRGDEASFPGLSERYLDRQNDRYVVGEVLREAVRFLRVNLLSPLPLADEPEYHVVFCRNVLIYMDGNARRAALSNLHQLLSPEGLLYVGHVEARVTAEGAFRQFTKEYPFAFSPTAPDARVATDRQTARPTQRTKPAASTEAAPRISRIDPTVAGTRAAAGPKSANRNVSGKLVSVRDAADAGRLDEAIGLCHEVLDKEPTNADALCLMGLVFKVRGQTVEAEGFFQKALYLDPRHEETLVHMMLLAQERGDERAAANFRRRADQAQGREASR